MTKISIAMLVFASFCLTGPAAFGQQQAAEEAGAQAASVDYPRSLSSEMGTVVVYTPQIDTWKEFSRVEARAAVAVTPTGEEEPVYGVAEFTADTDPNLELRVVAVENIEITVTSFPVKDAGRREQLDAIVRSTAQNRTHFVPLDTISTSSAWFTSVCVTTVTPPVKRNRTSCWCRLRLPSVRLTACCVRLPGPPLSRLTLQSGRPVAKKSSPSRPLA